MWKRLMRHFRGKAKDKRYQMGDPVMTRQPHLHVETDRMDLKARNRDEQTHEHHPPAPPTREDGRNDRG